MQMAETIIMRAVEDLIPYARNARTHSDAQVAQIAASIQEFGFTNLTAMSTGLAIALLATSSLLVALLSDFVAGSVDVVKQTLGWTDLFIGVIVVALIGNVSALFSAVKVAQKNQMDLAFGIGISGAAQIALLVVPVLGIASLFLGKPVNIAFSTAEVAAIFGSVLVISQISQDGEATWLSGVQMLVLYGLIGVLFYFLPSPT